MDSKTKTREFKLQVSAAAFEPVPCTIFAGSLSDLVDSIKSTLKLDMEIQFVEIWDPDFEVWARVLKMDDIPSHSRLKLVEKTRLNTLQDLREVARNARDFLSIIDVLNAMAQSLVHTSNSNNNYDNDDYAYVPSQLNVLSVTRVVNGALEHRFNQFSKDKAPVVARFIPAAGMSEMLDICRTGFQLPLHPGMYGRGLCFPGDVMVKACTKDKGKIHQWLLCNVAEGATCELSFRDATLTKEAVFAKGYDSVTGPFDPSKNEIADLVVYHVDQALPMFIVSVRYGPPLPDSQKIFQEHQQSIQAVQQQLMETAGGKGKVLNDAGGNRYNNFGPISPQQQQQQSLSPQPQLNSPDSQLTSSSQMNLRPTNPQCSEHSKDLEVYCEACSIVVCAHCVLLGSHKGHKNVMLSTNLDRLYNQYLGKAQGCLEALPPRYQDLERSEESWKEKHKEVETQKNKREKEIRGAFAELKFEVVTRELMLHGSLKKEGKARTEKLEALAQEYRARVERMYASRECMQRAQKENDQMGMLVAGGDLLYELQHESLQIPEIEDVVSEFDKRVSKKSISLIKGLSFASTHIIYPSNTVVKNNKHVVIQGLGFSKKPSANTVTWFQEGLTFAEVAVLSSTTTQLIVEPPKGLVEGDITCSITINGASSGKPVKIGVFVADKPPELVPIRNGAAVEKDAVTVVSSDPSSLSAFIGTEKYVDGQYYWEVDIIQSRSQLIGVSFPDNQELLLPYEGTNCWLFQSTEEGICQLWAFGERQPYGAKITDGSTLGMLLDADKGTLEYFLNKESLGVGFQGIPQGTVAAVVLYPGCKVRMNWKAHCPRPIITAAGKMALAALTKGNKALGKKLLSQVEKNDEVESRVKQIQEADKEGQWSKVQQMGSLWRNKQREKKLQLQQQQGEYSTGSSPMLSPQDSAANLFASNSTSPKSPSTTAAKNRWQSLKKKTLMGEI